MSDLIDRQAAIDALNMQAEEMSHWSERYQEQRRGVLTAVNIVADCPSIQPECKTGRWIESNPQDSKLCRLMTCSECGKAYIVNINVPYEDWTEAHKFCVECGADMRGE